eukprot:5928842-Alexandrium_andersonii.AAC.1
MPSNITHAHRRMSHEQMSHTQLRARALARAHLLHPVADDCNTRSGSWTRHCAIDGGRNERW